MTVLRGYLGDQGDKPFADWFDALDHRAAAKVTIALTRMEQGNFSHSKSVGTGVYEYRIDFGPGYRIYFGKRWRYASDPAGRRHKETSVEGYCGRPIILG